MSYTHTIAANFDDTDDNFSDVLVSSIGSYSIQVHYVHALCLNGMLISLHVQRLKYVCGECAEHLLDGRTCALDRHRLRRERQRHGRSAETTRSQAETTAETEAVAAIQMQMRG